VRIAAPAVNLVYLDAALLLVNKPAGLLSVPGRGADKQDCLARRVQAEYPDALIVHRLDMQTSGLLLLARGKEMQRRLSIAFAQRQVDKRYLAVVEGRLPAKQRRHRSAAQRRLAQPTAAEDRPAGRQAVADPLPGAQP
jgi:23S rRNA-/tRNA-specific pseudouridylate synthase